MHIACLQTVRASVATTRCYSGGGRGGGDPQVNKFEQVSSVVHQMSLQGGSNSDVQGPGLGGRTLYSEAQVIMGNGHIGTP